MACSECFALLLGRIGKSAWMPHFCFKRWDKGKGGGGSAFFYEFIFVSLVCFGCSQCKQRTTEKSALRIDVVIIETQVLCA